MSSNLCFFHLFLNACTWKCGRDYSVPFVLIELSTWSLTPQILDFCMRCWCLLIVMDHCCKSYKHIVVHASMFGWFFDNMNVGLRWCMTLAGFCLLLTHCRILLWSGCILASGCSILRQGYVVVCSCRQGLEVVFIWANHIVVLNMYMALEFCRLAFINCHNRVTSFLMTQSFALKEICDH